MNLLFCFCSFISPVLAASGARLTVRWMGRSFFPLRARPWCLGLPIVNLIEQTMETHRSRSTRQRMNLHRSAQSHEHLKTEIKNTESAVGRTLDERSFHCS